MFSESSAPAGLDSPRPLEIDLPFNCPVSVRIFILFFMKTKQGGKGNNQVTCPLKFHLARDLFQPLINTVQHVGVSK